MENAGIANDIKGKLFIQSEKNKQTTNIWIASKAFCRMFFVWIMSRSAFKLSYNSIYSIEKKELLSNVFWNIMKELEFL